MSYIYNLAGDAQADLRVLEPWLQEETLDEIELIASDPSLVPEPSAEGDSMYAFVREREDVKHHVVLTIARNDPHQSLTVLGILHRTLPRPPTG